MTLKNTIYLDYNATSPVRPEVIETVMEVMRKPHNASSVHREGRAARKVVEEARVKVASLVNSSPAQVIFNSGATEGNNTVLKYFSGQRVLVSAIEHPSVLEIFPECERVPALPDGTVDLNALEQLLKTGPRATLVSVMMVNNETGVIQPIAEAAALAKQYGSFFHCDAVQAAGRLLIDMAAMNIDFLTLSAHKIGGPQGIGALALGLCGVTPVLLDGGGQEKKARAGTENVAGIAGFGKAAGLAMAGLKAYPNLALSRNRLETELKKISPDMIIHGQDAPRVANTSMLSLPGASSETLLMAFDLEGIALSNGSACSSGTVRASHVLKAMNVSDDIATCAVRVSLGWNTKESDINALLAAWAKIHERLAQKSKRDA